MLGGSIRVMEVCNKDNAADIFTKSPSKGLFELFQAKVGLVPNIHFRVSVETFK